MPPRTGSPRRFRARAAPAGAWREDTTDRALVWLFYARTLRKSTVRYAERSRRRSASADRHHRYRRLPTLRSHVHRPDGLRLVAANLYRFDAWFLTVLPTGRPAPRTENWRCSTATPRLQSLDPVPAFIRRALAAHPAARRTFLALAPTYRRDYVRWIVEAKKPETRERRLAESIRRLETNRKRVHDPGSRPQKP